MSADPSTPSFPAWFAHMVPRLPTVVRGLLPGAPLDARRRELVAAVVAGAAGAPAMAALHATWHDVLGPAELTEIDDEILAWAANSVAERPQTDMSFLPDEVEPAVRAALVAVVAHGVVTSMVAQRAGSVVDQVRGRTRISLPGLVGDLTAVAVGAPVTAPVVAVGLALGVVERFAPARPTVVIEAEPNLLAQLLAETVPSWLGSAWGRFLVANLPAEVPVAVKSGLSGATVRVGRGRVMVHNGVADDAWALFEGDIDALLRAGSQSLTRELRAARLRG